MYSRLNVSTRLILLLLFLVVFSTSLVGVFTYRKVNQVLIKEELKQMDTYTLLLHSKIQEKIKNLNRDALFLAQTPPIQGIIRARRAGGIDPRDNSTETIWRERLAKLFSGIANTNPEYFQVRYIGVEDGGREIVRVDQENRIIHVIPDADLQPKGDRSYFKDTIVLGKGTVYLSRIQLNREHDQISEPYTPVLRAATPVYSADGTVFGIVIINLALTTFFEDLASSTNIGRSIYVTNQAGEFLIHPDKNKTFRFEFNESYTISDEFKGAQNYFSKDTDTVIVNTENDRKIALGFRKVFFDPLQPQRNINIIVAADYYNIIAEALALRNEIIGMLIFLILLAFLLAYFSSKSIVDEISKLFIAVEHSPDAVIITDHKGTIEYVNEKFTRNTGYSRKEVIGSNPRILQSGQTPDEVYKDLWDTVLSGREWQGELLNKKKDGELYWESLSLLPIVGRSGKIHHVVGLQEDITLKKRMEEGLRNAKTAAEEANLAKSQFLANMSHELRTPLNAIIGYSEMLQEEADEQEMKTFSGDLHKIRGAGKHLLGLINDILDLSKIEAGKLELVVEPFSVAALIDEVTATAQPLVETRGNQLEVVSNAELGEMEGDMLKVRQVLFNLLSNAAKFTEHGKITLDAVRQTTSDRDWLMFKVSDTGIGMDKEELARVFEEFSQADRTTSRKYGGTGLGLTISRKICQVMQGDISVKSTPGEGSTFTVRLPAMLREESIEEEPGLTRPFGQYDLSMEQGPLVLVIDDELYARELMSRHLHKAGFQVALAANGWVGLELAKQLNPVAITLDVMMPEMDGWEVLQALKADPDLADIPVVMCTIVDDEQHGFSLGVAEYLTKPVDPKRLQRILTQLCPGGECQVLVVEDDSIQRRMICRELQNGGWQVFEAENGRVAMDLLREKSVGVILLDLLMPEMNGFEFVETVKKDPTWRDVPIVVLTSKDLTNEDRSRLNGYVETIVDKGDQGLKSTIRNIQKVLRNKVIVKKHAKSE